MDIDARDEVVLRGEVVSYRSAADAIAHRASGTIPPFVRQRPRQRLVKPRRADDVTHARAVVRRTRTELEHARQGYALARLRFRLVTGARK